MLFLLTVICDFREWSGEIEEKKLKLISNESQIWILSVIHRRVFKVHTGSDCDREYIDRETASAFSNWPAPRVPWGLLLTKAKDSADASTAVAHQHRVPQCASADKLC